MINKKRVMSLGMALLMSASVPGTALAVSPEFARTEEEWARLRDNTMEYDELAGLIHEYNTTVQNNQYAYKDYLGKDRQDVERDYRDLADELYASMSGDDDMQSMISDLNLEIQARKMQQNADDNVDDGQIVLMGYQQAEDNLVVSAQSNMINYFKKQQDLELAKKNRELLETTYNVVVAQFGQGVTTQIDVLNAKENLQRADQAIKDTEASITSLRQRLCVMLGWKYDANPEIREIPLVDLSVIDSMDPVADKAAALEKNYTLRINKRKYDNAKTEEKREDLRKTIENNEQSIGASLVSAYQSVLAAKAAYLQAVNDTALETQNMQTAQPQHYLGTISDLQYLQQQYALLSKQAAENTAELSLREAIETYNWSVNGLASAG